MATTAPTRLLSTSLTAGKAAVPTVVGGDGIHFELKDGRRVIDASNTAAPLGHRHPEIVEAVRAAADAPVVNEGWGWWEREAAAEDLIRIGFQDEEWIGAVRFFISASEANDVALALCQALTGRRDLATRLRAYHGGAGLARDMTVQPQWHGGLSSLEGGVAPAPPMVPVHTIAAPTSGRITGQADPTLADDGWVADATEKLSKSAAVILDYSQGGIYHAPHYQDRVAAIARETGTIWIADETVTGFGRVGGWQQFHRGDSRPDMVTMGKSLAAGGAAAGALLISKQMLERLSGKAWQTYSTFRGHPIEVAAIRAHLKVAERDRVHERATELDAVMEEQMRLIAEAHPSVRRIDGRGLHWTVELHGPDWRTWKGEEAEPLASRVAARALEADVLITTSGEQTSLFIAPPLIAEADDIKAIAAALDHGLAVADAELERGGEGA
ncbi:aminotransferase class III-fold pyridoxal phosphate-dependent enzyme [Conexibacter arvalis]|uniref:4-aminobutyrate aminotransferase-like enzyme n=1 Tax=Conexibacter arvalis TaxID=912552 RepID=A0A840IDM9_9ACTN|nr:aminotransferase class III-fold pyridoxal phosphate-dependent enzyme [Conexibacter arvalis]MBB4662174.1 4-aminobutyrate aminotransferase-like enzyme [Conexibacter arvalis]